jgi:hypothetical protein
MILKKQTKTTTNPVYHEVFYKEFPKTVRVPYFVTWYMPNIVGEFSFIGKVLGSSRDRLSVYVRCKDFQFVKEKGDMYPTPDEIVAEANRQLEFSRLDAKISLANIENGMHARKVDGNIRYVPQSKFATQPDFNPVGVDRIWRSKTMNQTI